MVVRIGLCCNFFCGSRLIEKFAEDKQTTVINQLDHLNILNFYQKLQLTTKSYRQDSELSASCSLTADWLSQHKLADCLRYQPLGSEADSVADSWTLW